MNAIQIPSDRVSMWLEDCNSMTEKPCRQFLGRRALSLGYGGISAISRETGMARGTIARARDEILAGDIYQKGDRNRKEGGGRHTVQVNFRNHIDALNYSNGSNLNSDLNRVVETMLNNYAYGDPSGRGTFLKISPEKVVEHLHDDYMFKISETSVRRIFDDLGYSLQKNQKLDQVGNQHPLRNTQFEYRKELMNDCLKEGIPMVSMDSKAKIKVGLFENHGREWRKINDPRAVSDHDFGSMFLDLYHDGYHDFSEERMKKIAIATPNGVYCLNNNEAYVSVGMSSDTSEFAGHTLCQWWEQMGQKAFPNAKALCILCDGGGSNRASGFLWKLEVARFAIKYGFDYVQVFHHPPGTSKWDPIEHRLWSLVSIHWRAQPLSTFEIIRDLIGSTTSKTGLLVLCDLDYNEYLTEAAKKNAHKLITTDEALEPITPAEVEFNKIAYLEYMHEDPTLRKWNFKVIPYKS